MKINMKDNLATENINAEYQKRSYDDLSSEFQRLFPSAVRTIELIQLMYNRLTLVEKLSHKTALTKIYNDHKHLSGFSRRNIRRNLPLDNRGIPRRVRPSWPKNSDTQDNELAKLSTTTLEHNQDILTTNDCLAKRTSPINHQKLQERPVEKVMTNCITEHEAGDSYDTIYAENLELKEATLRQTALIKANDISAYEIEFTIPKEKYPHLEAAMKDSRDSVYVIFDKAGIFERAVSDVFRGKLNDAK